MYMLSRGHDEPEIHAKTEFYTKWEGSKYFFISRSLLIFLQENDNLSHLDMQITLNGDFLLFGITMSTGIIYAWILKAGVLYPALDKTRIHNSTLNF